MRTDRQAVRGRPVAEAGTRMSVEFRGTGGTVTGDAKVNGETAEEPQTGQKSLAALREPGAVSSTPFSASARRSEVRPPGVQIWKRKESGSRGGPKADAASAAACMAPKKISSSSA